MVRTLLLLLLLAHAGGAAARWQRVESAAFVVYAQGSAESARMRAVQLQAFDQLLRQLWHIDGPPPATKVSVYFVPDDGAFDDLGAGAGYDGFYTATPGAIAAFVRAGNSRSATRALHTMFHEYAHHFMFAHLPAAYPAWYVEGVASYLETARFEAHGTVYGDYDYTRMKSLMLQSWLPMAHVIGSDWSGIAAWQRPLFYAQSWLAVHYLARDADRAARLARYLGAVAAGQPSLPAFETAFGYPVQQIDKPLIDYAGSKALTQTRLDWLPPPPLLSVRELPASADALLLPAARLAIGVPAEAREALLARVRKLAAKTPDDNFAQTVRAEAEIRLGDPQAGLALLAPLEAAAPADAQLAMLHGLALVVLRQPARDVLARADALAPEDYRTLFLLGIAAPVPPDAAARAAILRAYALAPQVGMIAFAAAQVRLMTGDGAGARRLLQQLANDPHGGPLAARAATMLLQMQPD